MLPEVNTQKTYTVEVSVKYVVEVPESFNINGNEKLFSDNTRLVTDKFSLISDNLRIEKEKIRVLRH